VDTGWTTAPGWAAVVVAGGRGSRLGGVDKAAVQVAGRSLLARALDAVAEAGEVVVVGDPVPTERPVRFVRESPRWGGPVAALLTGVDGLLQPPGWVAVIAVDMPHLTPTSLRRLHEAAPGHDGAVLVGPDGRRQLALVVSGEALARARPPHEDQDGMPLRRLLDALDLVDVPAQGAEHRDVDTWDDLRELDVGGPA
jgi:molybdopterin-guanine dinucleotide biosynthesis protein A